MKRNNKGFTLAEMLIVVAIIGVLIAIVTTTISNSLEKAREATDLANIRSACSQVIYAALQDEGSTSVTGEDRFVKVYKKIESKKVKYQLYVHVTQKKKNWQTKGFSVAGKTGITFKSGQEDDYYVVSYNATSDAINIIWYSTFN